MVVEFFLHGRRGPPVRSELPIINLDSLLDVRNRKCSLEVLRSWLDLEISTPFELDGRSPDNVARQYLDEDGDRVILDCEEAYREAVKSAVKQNKNRLDIYVDAFLKEDSNKTEETEEAAGGVIPEMRRPHSSIQEKDPEPFPSDPPSWFQNGIDQMKNEVTREIRSSLSVSGSSGAYSIITPHSLPTDCDLCCRKISDAPYVCLHSCSTSTFCGECVSAGAHPPDHVMLRIPRRIPESPERLIDRARQLLANTEQPRMEESVIEKAPTMPAIPKDYDMEVVVESETTLMNELTDSSGAYWKRWTVANTGRLQWDTNVQLILESTSGPEVQPFALEATVPPLAPGQQGEVVVWVYGPLRGSGEFSASWMMHAKQADIDFGPLLCCQWTLQNEEEEEFSVVTTPESTGEDFELVARPPPDLQSLCSSGLSSSAATVDEEEEEMEAVCNDQQQQQLPVETEDAVQTEAVTPTAELEEETIVKQPEEVADSTQEATEPARAEVTNDTNTETPRAQHHGAEGVQQIMGGALKVAATAMETARSVLHSTTRALNHASRLNNTNRYTGQVLWTPPNEQWRPTETASAPQSVDDWMPPGQWTPRDRTESATVIMDSIGEPAPPLQPGEFEQEMDMLASMGFTDVERNLALLRESDADLSRVVDALVSEYEFVTR